MKTAWIDILHPEQWKRLAPLLDEILDLDPREVPSYLERVGAVDTELRRRIGSFLRADRAADGFLSTPAAGWGLEARDASVASLPDSDRVEPVLALPEQLGRYRVLQELGRGGMGVVFLGREKTNGRAVALKMLPDSFSSNAVRVALFLREARLLASLHHPNIATIHGLERSESGQRFLVLELVEGRTLAECIATEPLPMAMALDVGHQIASALAAAHAQRIVHRDLKPSNLMLTSSGLVKVLDFGIAKHVSRSGLDAPLAGPESVLRGMEPGMRLGTPGYMSPEQILDLEQSASSDAFSFGCVLYECITGVPAFEGSNRMAILAATLHSTVDLSRLPAQTPEPVRSLLRQTLERDSTLRMGDLAQAAATLAEFLSGRRDRIPHRKRSPGPDDQLPIPLSPFIGRDRELQECEHALCRSRLVTLTGAGGCGKTRLAIETARGLSSDDYAVIWFADLAPATDASGVRVALAAAAEVRGVEGSEVVEVLYRRLAGRTGLLILDNCEHVLSECASIVRLLLERCPKLRILATSREWLGVPGELMLRVPPLPVPDPEIHFALESIASNESVRLFAEHAAVVRPGFRVDADTAVRVAEVCRALDGIPLAIELAAALLRQCDLDEIVSSFAPSTMPRPGENVDETRHSTLSAAIDLSYRRLDEPERRYFEALSVFSGGWSLESATAVCGGGDDVFLVLDRLTHLMDQSLILVDPAEHLEPRYRFLEPIRSFARSRLSDAPDCAILRRRHVEHFVDLAEQLEPRVVSGSGQILALSRFEADHQNLLAALRTCETDPRWSAPSALRIAKATWRFWYMRGHFALGRDAIATALALPGTEPSTSTRAHALAGAGVLTMYLRDDVAARRLYREALALHREGGDAFGEASVLNHLGAAAAQRGYHERARVFFEGAMALFEGLNEPRWLALMLNNLGAVARQKGDLVTASERFDRAIPLARDIRNLDDLGLILVNSALVSLRLGRVHVARDRIHEAIGVVRDAGARRVATAALEVASEVLLELGLPEDAARLLGSAEHVRAVIGVPADDGWRRAQQPFLDRLRTCLDPSRYHELVHEGKLVSFEEVLDHVCRLVETHH